MPLPIRNGTLENTMTDTAPDCPNCHRDLVWTGWLDWWQCQPCSDEWVLDDEGYLIGPFHRRRIETVRTSLV